MLARGVAQGSLGAPWLRKGGKAMQALGSNRGSGLSRMKTMFLPEAVSRARVASSVARKTWGLPDSAWPGGPVKTLASDSASWYC